MLKSEISRTVYKVSDTYSIETPIYAYSEKCFISEALDSYIKEVHSYVNMINPWCYPCIEYFYRLIRVFNVVGSLPSTDTARKMMEILDDITEDDDLSSVIATIVDLPFKPDPYDDEEEEPGRFSDDKELIEKIGKVLETFGSPITIDQLMTICKWEEVRTTIQVDSLGREALEKHLKNVGELIKEVKSDSDAYNDQIDKVSLSMMEVAMSIKEGGAE